MRPRLTSTLVFRAQVRPNVDCHLLQVNVAIQQSTILNITETNGSIANLHEFRPLRQGCYQSFCLPIGSPLAACAECWAGNDEDEAKSLGPSSCSVACPGNGKQICGTGGGTGAHGSLEHCACPPLADLGTCSVRLPCGAGGATANSVFLLRVPELPPAFQAPAFQHVGCFNDWAWPQPPFPTTIYAPPIQTVQYCAAMAFQRGFTLFGLLNGKGGRGCLRETWPLAHGCWASNAGRAYRALCQALGELPR